MEGKLSRGESVNLDEYGRASSHLRRLWQALGVERRAKPVASLGETTATPLWATDECGGVWGPERKIAYTPHPPDDEPPEPAL
jgi:hypothetical protein